MTRKDMDQPSLPERISGTFVQDLLGLMSLVAMLVIALHLPEMI